MERRVTTLTIPYPAGGHLELLIRPGAGKLRITSAEQAEWVVGSYVDPSGSLPLDIEHGDSRATLTVGRSPVDFIGLVDGVPDLSLRLGRDRPFSLRVESGAGLLTAALGHLPLERLEVAYGAGTVELAFDAPNPVEMALLKLSVGAGRCRARGLAHAGFRQLEADGGAGELVLGLEGILRHDATARLAAAMGSIQLQVPDTTAVEVTSSSLLGNVQADPGFSQLGGTLANGAARAGTGPRVRVRASIALGRLRLVALAPAAIPA